MNKVGSIVRSNAPWDGNSDIVGKLGKVIGVSEYGTSCVEFFEPIKLGHDGGFFGGREGHCWSIDDRYLDPVYPYKNPKFKEGDLVMSNREVYPFKDGAFGIVKKEDGESVLVEFLDYSHSAHDGDGTGKVGHCWWVGPKEMDLIYRPEVSK